jgi:hypothetical protein
MRKATEREQEFFDRLEAHPAFQLFVSFFALVGFSVTLGFVIVRPADGVAVLKTMVLLVVGMGAGYTICAIRNYD